MSNRQLMGNEVSLNDWYDYLYFLASDADSLGPDAFYKALPDSNERNVKYLYQDKWFKIFMTDVQNHVYPEMTKKDRNAYLENANHIEYMTSQKIPLTGITYEQASDYCRWKSEMESRYITRAKKINGSLTHFRFTYRLPTSAEWMAAAIKGIRNPARPDVEKDYRMGKNEKNCMLLMFNYHNDPLMCEYFKTYITNYSRCGMVDVDAFNQNYLGLNNMMGNVAEMSSEKGIALGGSYLQSIGECQPESSGTYTSSAEWLGFRLIADLQVLNK